MHDTAYELGREFFRVYCNGRPARILELGSQNLNGSLREVAPPGSTYIGVDLTGGDGVDIVLQDPYSLPFEKNHFDVVLASSCFEHDQLFWLSFLELVRVAKNGGFIYLNTPSNGEYHSHPYDNWRFYPDAALALIAWAQRQGQKISLMESFIARRKADRWNDCVIVLRKGERNRKPLPNRRIVDHFPDSYNVRYSAGAPVQNLATASEDMFLLDEARDKLVEAETRHDALMTNMRAGFGELQDVVTAAAAEVQHHRDRIGEIARERDEHAAALLRAADKVARLQVEIEAATRRIVELEAERLSAAGLQAEIATLRGAVAAAEVKARESSATEFAMRGDIERLRRQVQRAERDAKQRAVALAEAETKVSAGRAAAAAKEQELAAIREALRTAECKVQERQKAFVERDAEAVRAEFALRTELETQRQAFASAELEAAERGAAAAAQLAERNGTIATANERLAEHQTANAELAFELRELCERLDASRRLNKELLAVFRAGVAAAPVGAGQRSLIARLRLPTWWPVNRRRSLLEQPA